VVYKTGYHWLRGGKGLQALTEDARTRMGEICKGSDNKLSDIVSVGKQK
jgi:hypothetical protein